jgi:HAD superfamily hydrolase (TIGR01509 family)
LSLEAIIFDVDGTLAETEEVHRAAFNFAFLEAGLPWHWNQALYGRLLKVTGGKERIRHYLYSSGIDTLSADPGAAIAALHAAKTARYAQMLHSGEIQLRPGFHALLEEARRAGVRMAIATTTSLPNVEALLKATHGERAMSYFEVIAAGDSVASKKPAPDIYLSALRQLRLPASACLAVEDSQNGLRAALAADLATLVIRSSYTEGDDFSGAALVVGSLAEASERLGTSSVLEALRKLRD